MSNLSPTAAAIAATAGLAASSAYGIPLEHQNALLHDQQNARYSAHYNQLAQSSMHSIHTQPASTPPSANTYLQYVSNGGSPNIDGQNSKPFRSTLNPAAATFHMNSNNNAYASNSPSHYQTSTVSGATTGDFYPNAAAAAAAAAGLNDFQNPANTAAMHHTSFTTNDAFAALQASSASAPANQFHNGFGGAAAAPAAAAHSFGHQQQQPSPPSSTSSFNNNSNVCRLFLQGNCHFGANCRYVHPGTSNSTVNNTFTSAQQSSTSTPAVNGNLSSMNAASAAAVLNNAAALNSGANSSQYNLVLEQLLLAQKQGAMNDQVAGLLQQLISLNLNSNGNSGANAAPNNNASVSMNNSSPLMGNAHLSNQGNAVNQMNNGGHRGSGFGNTARGNGFEFRRDFPSGAGSASQGGFAAGGGDFNRGFQNNFSRQDQFGRSFSASSPSAAGGLVNANRGGGAGGSSKWSAYSGFALNNMRDEALEKALFSSQIVTGINFDKYDEIEVSVTGEEIAQPIHSFDDLQLPQTLRDNIQLARYTKPTPIQRHALPNALKLRDVMACAQTGSGKTAAYLFPLITHLLTFIAAGQWPVRSYERRQSCPFGLILAPTRELATQIYDEAVKFTYRTGLHSVVVYGGVDAKIQYRELGSGNCDLLIATPGRLIDFLDRRRISLQNVGYLVFDEADRMLDMGFEPQIRKIITEYDLTSQRQTLMFSATFPREIQKLAADFLDRYIFVTIGRVGSASEMITQKLVYVEDHEKRDVLLKELGGCDELTLIFVSTKKGADILEEYLLEKRVSAASIHGDRSQAEREYALKQFKSREANVLIATDVASRGLDIPHVKYVINFDLPTNIDDYVHRIGRTGRAGNTGTAISFYNETSNSNLAHELYSVLLEAKQLIPDFLEKVVIQARRGGGNRFSGFGGKDYRESHQYGSRGGRGRGGFRGRGRGGNGGGRGGGGSRGGFDRAFSVNAGSVAASSAAAVNALAAAAAASRPQSHGFARQSQFDDRANFASQDTSAASSGGRSSAANIPAMW